MNEYRAIDVCVFPFTPDTKASAYSSSGAVQLKDSLVHLGIWDRPWSTESILADMNDTGVGKALVCAQEGGSWRVGYDYVYQMCKEAPNRLYGTAGIDPRDISGGLRKLEAAVKEYGFVAAHSYPHWFRLSPASERYYPFYAKCVELGVPVEIQIGQAFQPGLVSVGRPEAVDIIASDFPDLRIVAIHTGYPWERELVSVAWKHPNVYIGADCWHPRDWPAVLVDFIQGEGKEKVMWGTNKPVVEMKESLDGITGLRLDGEVEHLLLRGNVERVFDLSSRAVGNGSPA